MRTSPPPLSPSSDPEARNYQSDSFELGSLTSIVLAHDFICPWCYVGFFQARKLTEQFGVTFDWRGFELIPPSMSYNPPPPKPVDPDAPPKPPNRFDLFAEDEGLVPPAPRPKFVRSHKALLGAEFARNEGDIASFDSYIEAVYLGFWVDKDDISDIAILKGYAAKAALDPDAFVASVEAERYVEQIVPYDDDAYSAGIRHVPTFIFNGEEKLAEAEYTALAKATERYLVRVKPFLAKLAAAETSPTIDSVEKK